MKIDLGVLETRLQQNMEGPYDVVTRINDVVYRIQKGSRGNSPFGTISSIFGARALEVGYCSGRTNEQL